MSNFGNKTGNIFNIDKSILEDNIIATGIFTTDSATAPADDVYLKDAGYWDGKLLMPLTGDCAYQMRKIASYSGGVTGIFSLDADNPFTSTPGLVAYVILVADMALISAPDSAANLLPSNVIGNKEDVAAAPSNTTSIVAIIKQVYATLFSFLSMFLVLTETGATLTTDGTEQNLYYNNAPPAVFDPKIIQIDFTNQTATETVVIREYYRIKTGGDFILLDEKTFAGVQDPELINIHLEENRYGVKVTIEKTGGTNQDYDYEGIFKI